MSFVRGLRRRTQLGPCSGPPMQGLGRACQGAKDTREECLWCRAGWKQAKQQAGEQDGRIRGFRLDGSTIIMVPRLRSQIPQMKLSLLPPSLCCARCTVSSHIQHPFPVAPCPLVAGHTLRATAGRASTGPRSRTSACIHPAARLAALAKPTTHGHLRHTGQTCRSGRIRPPRSGVICLA